MAADLFSSFLGMTLQATGNNNNAWGTILNGSALNVLERAIAGNATHAVTGGTLDLSTNPPPNGLSAALDMIQVFSGTLTAAQIVQMPNLSKVWYIFNSCTGAFPFTVKTPSGTATQIPSGTGRYVICDGSNNIVRLDRDAVGSFVYESVLSAGNLSCNGASVLKTDYPDLYAKIGTMFGSVDSIHFTLPNLMDTGRFLRSSTGAIASGVYQANQNKSHTHTGSGNTGTESVLHTHTGGGETSGMDAGNPHQHTYFRTNNINIPSDGNNRGTNSGGFQDVTSLTDINHGHPYSFTTNSQSAFHTHAYSFTTSTGSADGTESRPESLVVIISIRY